MDAFSERLAVPRWWHLAAVAAAALIGAFFAAYTDSAGLRAVIWVVTFLLLEALLLGLGVTTVAVSGGELRAGGRALPLADVRGAEQVDDVKAALHPYVYAVTRPWVRTAVRVGSRDETWLVSTRHPDALVGALSPRAGTPPAR